MKTLKVLTTAFLVTITLSGFATDHSVIKSNGASIPSPGIIWGDPTDVNAESVESLKNPTSKFPAILWGSASDVFSKSVESLKSVISNPGVEWGNAGDVNLPSVEALKKVFFFKGPEMVFGDASDIDLSSVESLKIFHK